MRSSDDLELLITGKLWKNCPGCEADGHIKRIVISSKACQDHGGEPTNCRTCGTGSKWWVKSLLGKPKCPQCDNDPTSVSGV